MDLAQLIKENRNKVQERFPGEKNPKNLLFLRYEGRKGIGKPFLQLTIIRDRFATRHSIIDEDGMSFQFKANAFKHRITKRMIS